MTVNWGSSRAATAAVAFSAAALTVAGALALLVRSHRKRTARSDQQQSTAAFVPEGCKKVLLEPNDIWTGLHTALGMPVGTTTFFKGDLTACEKHLKEKFRSVVKANPWVAGWTEHDYDTPVMIYPSEVSDHIADSMIQICNEPLVLGGPETAVIQASRFCLPYGRSTIGKPQVEAPLVRLVLMPCELAENASSRKSADFAVVFFTSHVLGGARTYYKLLSMLSVDHPVASLNAVRVPGVYDKVVACLGQDPTAWLRTSINFIGSSLCGIYFGRAPQLYRLVVCPEKLAKLKASSVDNSSNGEAFVSTNDIITACLGCLVGARLMHMAVDFKQRFVDIGDDCVGNYETTVQLDDRYLKTPLAVRHAVTAISDRCAALDGVEGEVGAVMGRNEPLAALPAWWQFPFTRHAKITNWVTSTKQLVLPGCQQVFHTPAGDDPIKMYKMCPFEIVIVFRMNAEQTGVVVVSKLFSKQDYVNALPVVDFRDDFV